MNIKVDIQELLKENGEPPLESNGSIEQLKDLVRNSLQSLKEEIKKEEKKSPCYIMMYLLPPEEEQHLPIDQRSQMIRLAMHGYSKPLTDKIYAALGDGTFASVAKVPIGFIPN